MAGDVVDLQWRGFDQMKAQFRALPDKMRRRVLRNSLAVGGRIVRDGARAQAPVLRRPDSRRKPGTVRAAIKVRTSKQSRAAGHVGVFVNVQPLKGKAIAAYKASSGKAASTNRDDPFYWRWLNWGRKGRAGSAARAASKGLRGLIRSVRSRRAQRAVSPLPALRFLEAGAAKLGQALRKIEQVLGPALQRIFDRKDQA